MSLTTRIQPTSPTDYIALVSRATGSEPVAHRASWNEFAEKLAPLASQLLRGSRRCVPKCTRISIPRALHSIFPFSDLLWRTKSTDAVNPSTLAPKPDEADNSKEIGFSVHAAGRIDFAPAPGALAWDLEVFRGEAGPRLALDVEPVPRGPRWRWRPGLAALVRANGMLVWAGGPRLHRALAALAHAPVRSLVVVEAPTR